METEIIEKENIFDELDNLVDLTENALKPLPKREKGEGKKHLVIPKEEIEEIEGRVLDRLEEVRQQKNITYYEMAKRAGIMQSTINQLKRRGSHPRIATLYKICQGMGMTLTDFFSTIEIQYAFSEEEQELVQLYRKIEDKENQAIALSIMKMMAEKNYKVIEEK